MSEIPTPRQQADLAGLHDRFPGFFPPNDDEVKDFITRGMVAFDTNALLDVYRFSAQARVEYLAALRKLGARLWIPHRVGQELLERRLTVIKECSTATAELTVDLNKAFKTVIQLVRTFGNRRGLSKDQVTELEQLTTQACRSITISAGRFYEFELDLDKSVKGDPILDELVALLDNKVGPPLANPKEAKAEAQRRIENKIPPGYKDIKKDSEHAIGDYLIWRQLLNEAARRKLPTILVTNDQKSDWTREEYGKKISARPELITEMRTECNTSFHLISVRSFLVQAQNLLGARVSHSTFEQATTKSHWTHQESILLDFLQLSPPITCIDSSRDSRNRIRIEFNGREQLTIDATNISDNCISRLYDIAKEQIPSRSDYNTWVIEESMDLAPYA